MKEESSEGKCNWCGQKVKEVGSPLHKKCQKLYYDKAEEALEKAGLGEYPEMTVIERSHLKKVKICRGCKFPMTEEQIRKTKQDVDKLKLKGMGGLCDSCIKIRTVSETKPRRLEEDD